MGVGVLVVATVLGLLLEGKVEKALAVVPLVVVFASAVSVSRVEKS